VKQCRGLAASGHQVCLVVADGKGDEEREGVTILDVGKPNGRLCRMTTSTRRIYRKAMSLDADVYHLHDPELIPVGLFLKLRGKTVVFDAHEDLPKQLLGKPYLGPVRLRMIAYLITYFERFACSRLDAIVTATPAIGEKFRRINDQTIVVNNYPLPTELHSASLWATKKRLVCYVGSISAARGICEIIEAMSLVKSNARLMLAGSFAEPDTESRVKSLPGWSRVDVAGYVDRARLRQLLGDSVAGLVIFHPLPNHVDAQPNKLFEYMSAGIPVIASNFSLWKEIVDGTGCGLCVDPMDPSAIAAAIDQLVSDTGRAKRLGDTGRRAVLDQFNWPGEERKLHELYSLIVEAPT
jgi:glycosyltransferase involved in cell wall biosynthesis